MYNISEKLGHVVAADTQSAVGSINDAIISQSRMCATIVEASIAADLPIGAVQGTLAAISEGLRNMVVNRAGVADAVRELSQIQRMSNLKEVGFGCPTGPRTDFFTSASADVEN
ncbi:MAG: hypothetical protein Q8R44_03940 [Novosphingobium sp.]|nr:hypothetical protein [Novosphingobium sp.]